MIALVALGLSAVAVFADASSLVAAEVIPAGDGVTVANAELRDGDGPEVYDLYAGREVRRTVYAGQPITWRARAHATLAGWICPVKSVPMAVVMEGEDAGAGDGACDRCARGCRAAGCGATRRAAAACLSRRARVAGWL